MLRMLMVVIALGALVTGPVVAEEPAKPPAKCDILEVANRYVAVHMPDFNVSRYKPVIRRAQESWEVEYQLPWGFIGAYPVLTISKNKCDVVKSLIYQ